MTTFFHLVKRFVGSVTSAPLSVSERAEIAAVLMPAENKLFGKLSIQDQRHAVQVLRRFDFIVSAAPIAARRAALLHDIGKIDSGLGTVMRVIASIIGPRTELFRRYHEHERIGIEMLSTAGSDPLTVKLLRGEGDARLVTALREADAI